MLKLIYKKIFNFTLEHFINLDLLLLYIYVERSPMYSLCKAHFIMEGMHKYFSSPELTFQQVFLSL